VPVRGECIDDGDRRACLELVPPRVPDTDEPVPDDDEPDGAMAYKQRDGREVVLYRGGARIAAVSVPNGVASDGELEALRADLDGDGRPELVIAEPIRIWNHLGWEFARVFVIGDAGITQLDVAEWGDGSIIAAADGRGCELLATTWDDLHHPIDPAYGTYLVGRPMRYDRGALVARGDVVVRRLRTFFHATDEAERPTPAAWLSSSDSEWWPELGPERLPNRRRTGTITAAARVRGDIALEIDLDDGVHLVLDRSADPFDWRRAGSLARLGSADTGVLFPEAYVPADPSAWIGTRAVVDSGRCEDGAERCFEQPHYVWLVSR
jgi:hypothetical protein